MPQATSELQILVKMRDEASGSIRRMGGNLSELGGHAKFSNFQLAALGTALSAFATITLKSAITAFAKAESQMLAFEGILSTLPPHLRELRGDLLAIADEAFVKYGASTEEAALVLVNFLKITKDLDTAEKLLLATFGMALETGRKYNTVGEQVADVVLRGTKTFERYGVEIRETDEILGRAEKVYRRFGPVIEKQNASLSVALKFWAEFKTKVFEALGETFAPAITLVTAKMTAWIAAQGGVEKAFERFAPFIKAAAVVLGILLVGAVIVAGVHILALVGISVLLAAKMAFLAIVVVAAAGTIISIWKDLKRDLGTVFNWLKGQINEIIVFFNRLWSAATRALDVAGRIGGGITGAVSGAFEQAKGFVGLQEGGIIPAGATVPAILHGPEAVIPLSKMGATGGITIILQGDFFTATEVAERFGNEIARIIKNQIRVR